MKKIIKLVAVVIVRVDTVLYKTFGFVSSFRRRFWVHRSERLQQDLDREHSQRDRLNAFYGTNYTTKQALELRNN